ncbi:hypothetical protein RB623_16440 [Mesorhizobium sp. LHD-90]|uniref:hypothetical protein n=1 Tax=Mesorhizobium sp. LHD-90 TaxID=3071414 RepID=UPI0027E200C3|nr:hypothetical protein [Mesorhizobium sp. LHD-90]MDQ6435648.1 hypothetical protein [Mesorhizobium sp. LHD-90]
MVIIKPSACDPFSTYIGMIPAVDTDADKCRRSFPYFHALRNQPVRRSARERDDRADVHPRFVCGKAGCEERLTDLNNHLVVQFERLANEELTTAQIAV